MLCIVWASTAGGALIPVPKTPPAIMFSSSYLALSLSLPHPIHHLQELGIFFQLLETLADILRRIRRRGKRVGRHPTRTRESSLHRPLALLGADFLADLVDFGLARARALPLLVDFAHVGDAAGVEELALVGGANRGFIGSLLAELLGELAVAHLGEGVGDVFHTEPE